MSLNLIAAVENLLAEVKAKVAPEVKVVQNEFHDIVNMAQTGLTTLAGTIGQNVVDAIKAGVISAATNTTLTGPEKADSVRKDIENAFKASVPTLTTGLINLGIELAVQAVGA
jgi:hypothetical protein